MANPEFINFWDETTRDTISSYIHRLECSIPMNFFESEKNDVYDFLRKSTFLMLYIKARTQLNDLCLEFYSRGNNFNEPVLGEATIEAPLGYLTNAFPKLADTLQKHEQTIEEITKTYNAIAHCNSKFSRKTETKYYVLPLFLLTEYLLMDSSGTIRLNGKFNHFVLETFFEIFNVLRNTILFSDEIFSQSTD